jgi:Fe-Mn family superoxide dismutase
MRELITLVEQKSSKDTVEIIDLRYSKSALTPVMSLATVNNHWGKLAHAYADRFNKHEGDSSFNYAGAVLHNIFFSQFRSPRTNNIPNGPIFSTIKSNFKSWDNFKEQFVAEALKLQGSGWIYLARDGKIKTIHNHQLRTDILILVDLWEHAYISDYGGNKERYIDNIWKIFDWNSINSRWGQAYK